MKKVAMPPILSARRAPVKRHRPAGRGCGRVDIVTLCGYIIPVRKIGKPNDPVSYPIAGGGVVVSVREAKAHFSALVDKAAQGEEITVTWHGRPRARLMPVHPETAILRVDRAWLDTMPRRVRSTPAETLVRIDRDARG